MKCFWMVLVAMAFGACYVPKKDKAEGSEPSTVVVQCESDVDCDDSNSCTTDLCDGDECVHIDVCAPSVDTAAPVPGPDTTVGPDTEPQLEPDTMPVGPDTVPSVDTEEPAPDTEPLPGPDTIEAEPDTDQPSPDTETVCVPDCGDNECGPDGCGGVCGTCVVDENDACTSPFCDPSGKCKGLAKDCDDKDACTMDSCDPTTGDCNHEIVECDDGNVCTTDSCNAMAGCQHAPVACDDKDACTADSCEAGKGCMTAPISCDDGDKCTDDTCDAATGCKNVAKVCDDGVGCSDDLCAVGVGCIAIWTCPCTKDADCSDSNPCTDDKCDFNKGCVYTPNTAACDDGNACTTGDTCSDSQCLGNGALDCDDGNACTTDGCDAAVGCLHQLVICNDKDACTTDTCDAATGCGYAPVDCDDGNVCTDDSCDLDKGCVYEDNTVDCNDNNACTKNDACVDGSCVGAEVLCGDKNLCTDESCDPTMGCVYAAVNCDDNDPWTIDFCKPDGGCQKASAKACEQAAADTCIDGNKCTIGECKPASECTAGLFECPPAGGAYCAYEPIGCNDSNACTLDTCEPDKGCAYATIVGCCSIDTDCAAGEKCEDNKCTKSWQVTIEVNCAADCEAWVYHDGDPQGNTSHWLDPLTITLSEDEACSWGVQVAAQVAKSVNPAMPWYGCAPGTPSLNTVTVKVNGAVKQGGFYKDTYICWDQNNDGVNEGEGNLQFLPAALGCP